MIVDRLTGAPMRECLLWQAPLIATSVTVNGAVVGLTFPEWLLYRLHVGAQAFL